MVRDYELMYIARPELDEEGLQAAVESVEQLVTGVGGSVVRTTSWGRRRLAYEVDHLRDGNYMLLHIRVDGGRVADIERALSIHETVFRHLLVVLESAEDGEAADGAAAAAGEQADDEARQAPVAAAAHDAPSSEDEVDDADDDVPAAADDDEEEI